MQLFAKKSASTVFISTQLPGRLQTPTCFIGFLLEETLVSPAGNYSFPDRKLLFPPQETRVPLPRNYSSAGMQTVPNARIKSQETCSFSPPTAYLSHKSGEIMICKYYLCSHNQ